MNWKSSRNISDNNYELPGDWLLIEYFEALNILFRVENSLRIFVYIILKSHLGEKWHGLSITSDDEENSTINAIAKRRIAQDKNYAYLGYPINSPLLHLTSGELIRIITSENYWKFFNGYFLGTKEIIKNKLDEIGNVRNSLAHFRPIKAGDVELIKQNSIHTLSEIEKTICDFINCPDIVPTNTNDNWYKELISLGNSECKISFKQSKKGEWIKLIITFNAPIFNSSKKYFYYDIRAANIRVTNILHNYAKLSNQIICATEVIYSPSTNNPEIVLIEKGIGLTFSKENLATNYSLIKKELEKIILQISQEVDLIDKDNLARGHSVEAINSILDKSEHGDYFFLQTKPFVTLVDQDSPVEFWGQFTNASQDFVTDTEFFPWMPVPIADDKAALPF